MYVNLERKAAQLSRGLLKCLADYRTARQRPPHASTNNTCDQRGAQRRQLGLNAKPWALRWVQHR